MNRDVQQKDVRSSVQQSLGGGMGARGTISDKVCMDILGKVLRGKRFRLVGLGFTLLSC